ncbi:hypothetical protein K8O92_09235 [Nocardia asteroides]|uniref:hypothetical protein n=1 Tax=Nocardia TaxID=1817 RepID=UPI00135C2C8F|nr:MULTISPECIES: hypothetical protein [Nocardia]MBF6204912.1 hypothetical protein [Streptomyces gardneri]UAK34055.1 hypothetical protein K8O92_09235 [Nocardia asteroides]
MSPHPITGHLRGGLIGVLVGVLAVAAHGAAGGGAPGSTELTLLLSIAAAVGSAAGAVRGRSRPSVVAGLLGAGQLFSHAALSVLLDHAHPAGATAATHPPLPTGGMLLAHTVATVGCAALIVLAERLYTAASGALRAILAPPRRARITIVPHRPDPGLPPYRCAPHGALGPRAPPVSG